MPEFLLSVKPADTEAFSACLHERRRVLDNCDDLRFELNTTETVASDTSLHDASVLGEFLVYAKDVLVVLLPLILLWKGKGKEIFVKQGDTEVSLKNLSVKEIENLLAELHTREQKHVSGNSSGQET